MTRTMSLLIVLKRMADGFDPKPRPVRLNLLWS